MSEKTAVGPRDIKEYLGKIAFGDQMAMLEAYQECFRYKQGWHGTVFVCGACKVTTVSPDQCRSCNTGFCRRTFCPSSQWPRHVCPGDENEQDIASFLCNLCSNKCTADICPITVCRDCADDCVLCRRYACGDHISFKDPKSSFKGVCDACVKNVANYKRRKIDDE